MGHPDTMKLRPLAQDSETLLVEVAGPDQPRTIEVALDPDSAPGIREALAMRPFKERYGSDYTYWLRGLSCARDAKSRAEGEWCCLVRVKLGRRNRDVKVTCSRNVYYQLRPLFPPEPPNQPLERAGSAGRSAPIR